MSQPSSSEQATCPACGTLATGKFCGNCGAPLRNVPCTSCGTTLVAGARFCHACGATTVKGGPARALPAAAPSVRRADLLPWGMTMLAVAIIAVLVLVRRSDASLGTTQPQNPAGDLASSPRAAAPDISSMSPRERAERLYDRTMMAKEAGKLDSANFFATMAVQAYGDLTDKTLDDRYDLGRLALVAGQPDRAQAQADTILAARPTHLLGLLLSEDATRARGNDAAANATHQKLVATAPEERKAQLPEYASHATELSAALARTVAPPAAKR